MEIILTKKVVVSPKAGFHVHVDYEHGDADLTTHSQFYIPTEAELIKFIEQFEIASQAINENRSYGKELPKRYSWLMSELGIELEYDQFANQSNYYAAMWVAFIEYVDEAGNLYSVEIKK